MGSYTQYDQLKSTTSYSYANNNPLSNIDPLGLIEYSVNDILRNIEFVISSDSSAIEDIFIQGSRWAKKGGILNYGHTIEDGRWGSVPFDKLGILIILDARINNIHTASLVFSHELSHATSLMSGYIPSISEKAFDEVVARESACKVMGLICERAGVPPNSLISIPSESKRALDTLRGNNPLEIWYDKEQELSEQIACIFEWMGMNTPYQKGRTIEGVDRDIARDVLSDLVTYNYISNNLVKSNIIDPMELDYRSLIEKAKRLQVPYKGDLIRIINKKGNARNEYKRFKDARVKRGL